VRAVLEHERTMVPIALALESLCYPHTQEISEMHRSITDNDTLAACFARCLLWALPTALPGRDEADGWRQYLDGWRPGAPRPATWRANFARAWEMVDRPEDVA
jgi:hypothetical protein